MRLSIGILIMCVSLLAAEAGWLDDLVKTAENVGRTTGDWAQGAAKDTIKAAHHAGKLTGDWIKTTGTDALQTVGSAGETAGRWLKETGQNIKENASDETPSLAQE